MKIFFQRCFLLINLCCILFSEPVESATLFVLKSADLSMFNDAIIGCQELFKNRGKNITLISRVLPSTPDEQKKLLEELKSSSAVLTLGSAATNLVADNLPEKPVVYSMLFAPSGKAHFKNKHMTGIFLDIPLRQQLELLHKVCPAVKNVGVLYNEKNSKDAVDIITAMQSEFGMIINAKSVNRDTDVPKAFSELYEKIDALWLFPDTTVCTTDSLKYILQFALTHKLPVMGFADYLVKAGALVGFQYDYKEIGRQTGEVVVRVIEGENPDNIPSSYPQRMGYILNLKVANHLGISIPQPVIKGAQTVISESAQ